MSQGSFHQARFLVCNPRMELPLLALQRVWAQFLTSAGALTPIREWPGWAWGSCLSFLWVGCLTVRGVRCGFGPCEVSPSLLPGSSSSKSNGKYSGPERQASPSLGRDLKQVGRQSPWSVARSSLLAGITTPPPRFLLEAVCILRILVQNWRANQRLHAVQQILFCRP